MKPVLWGGVAWDMLFACAWYSMQCDDRHVDLLCRLLLVQMPLLLPCERCRAHYLQNRPRVVRRARGEPKTAAHAFRWLYYLKDEVNRKNGVRSTVTMGELQERYLLFTGRCDEVKVADVLVLFAIEAEATGEGPLFVEMCAALAQLLPFPDDSQFVRALGRVCAPVATHAHHACRAARVEHGFATPPLSHFRTLASL